jgi:hypothetical protein
MWLVIKRLKKLISYRMSCAEILTCVRKLWEFTYCILLLLLCLVFIETVIKTTSYPISPFPCYIFNRTWKQFREKGSKRRPREMNDRLFTLYSFYFLAFFVLNYSSAFCSITSILLLGKLSRNTQTFSYGALSFLGSTFSRFSFVTAKMWNGSSERGRCREWAK